MIQRRQKDFLVIFQILAKLGQIDQHVFDFLNVLLAGQFRQVFRHGLALPGGNFVKRFDLGVAGRAGADFDILTADEGGAHHFRHGILADEIGVFLVDLDGDLHLGLPPGLGDAQHGDLADLRIEHLDQGALTQVVALPEFYQIGLLGLEPAFALGDHQQGHHGEDDQHQEKPPCQLFLAGKALFHTAMIPLSPGLLQAFGVRPGLGGLDSLPRFFPPETARQRRAMPPGGPCRPPCAGDWDWPVPSRSSRHAGRRPDKDPEGQPGGYAQASAFPGTRPQPPSDSQASLESLCHPFTA